METSFFTSNSMCNISDLTNKVALAYSGALDLLGRITTFPISLGGPRKNPAIDLAATGLI